MPVEEQLAERVLRVDFHRLVDVFHQSVAFLIRQFLKIFYFIKQKWQFYLDSSFDVGRFVRAENFGDELSRFVFYGLNFDCK